jgi:hypothetical protein
MIAIIKEYRYSSIQREKTIKRSINTVKKNQPAQELSDQETKGQTKMILSERDPVKVV